MGPVTPIGITAQLENGCAVSRVRRNSSQILPMPSKVCVIELGHGGTLYGLIREYTLSQEFQRNLAPSTQAEYRRMLTKAETTFGDMPIAALADWRVRKDFLDWREQVSRTSGYREADYRLSAISSMLTWAVERGRLSANPLKGFKQLYHSDRAEIIWLPEHIAAFMKMAPVELQQALLLALHTGQREGDLLRLPWSAYDGKTIRLRQGKSRRGQRLGQIILNPAVARCHLAATRWFFNLWVHRSGFTPLPSGAAERAVDAP